MSQAINDEDFRRVMIILYGVWKKAGQIAASEGLAGRQAVMMQEQAMTQFLRHCYEVRGKHD